MQSVDGKGCVDKNECIDFPCLNGGRCINEDPFYRCICPEGFEGENCALVRGARHLRLGMGAYAAILVCLLLILSKYSLFSKKFCEIVQKPQSYAL